MDFKKLKSGSDVRGVAMGENAVLTPAVAQLPFYEKLVLTYQNLGFPFL